MSSESLVPATTATAEGNMLPTESATIEGKDVFKGKEAEIQLAMREWYIAYATNRLRSNQTDEKKQVAKEDAPRVQAAVRIGRLQKLLNEGKLSSLQKMQLQGTCHMADVVNHEIVSGKTMSPFPYYVREPHPNVHDNWLAVSYLAGCLSIGGNEDMACYIRLSTEPLLDEFNERSSGLSGIGHSHLDADDPRKLASERLLSVMRTAMPIAFVETKDLFLEDKHAVTELTNAARLLLSMAQAIVYATQARTTFAFVYDAFCFCAAALCSMSTETAATATRVVLTLTYF